MFEGAIGQFALGEFTLSGVIPPIPPSPILVQSFGVLPKRRKPLDDDEAIILISQQLAQQFWKEDKKN